jgi:hypothetical protein
MEVTLTSVSQNNAQNSEEERIDEAILALLLLGRHDGDRTWKTFDWDALGRLHLKGLISNPAGKAKSVIFTEAGLKAAENLYDVLFAKKHNAAT